MPNQATETHVIKRYSPARLYDTSTLRYVDVAQLQAMVRGGAQVTVLDAQSGEDITVGLLRLAS